MNNVLSSSNNKNSALDEPAEAKNSLNYLMEIKSRLDLVAVARDLHPSLKPQGINIYQGSHDGVHDSKNGQCLTVWPGTNSWKCFNCGKGGDVIDLIGVSIYGTCYTRHGTEFVAALNEAARRAGLSQEFLSPEQKMELSNRERIYSLLTDAARWYNSQLANYPDIYEHLQTNYGFKESFIQEKVIGFAPPTPPSSLDPNETLDTPFEPLFEPLIEHLLNLRYTQKEIMASSLASKDCYTIYYGRIMILCWQNGKVVYFTARATRYTPYNKYETYPIGELKKYRKLKVRDEKNKQISELVTNNVLFGADTLKLAHRKGYILITEGAPDQLAAEQAGEPCISPLTTTFSHAQLDDLVRTVKSLKVYVCNDNEENQTGEKGALSTALFLEKQGIKTYLIKLLRPEGIDKTDLCEFLRDNGIEAFLKLYPSALRLPHYCLVHQPLPSHEESNDVKVAFINELADLALSVCHYDPLNLASLQQKLAEILKINKSLIKTMFRKAPGQAVEVRGSRDQPEGNGENPEQGDAERKSQSTMLAELTGDLELFHTGEGRAFTSFQSDGHTQTWPVRSRSFKLLLKERFYRQYSQVPRTPALEDALSLLEARALFGPQQPVFNRIARLTKVELGNFGDTKLLKGANGIWELSTTFHRKGTKSGD